MYTSSLRLDGTVFNKCSTAGTGGAIAAAHPATMTITGVTVEDCMAETLDGGGMNIIGGPGNKSFSMTGSKILRNSCPSGFANGMGVMIQDIQVTISDYVFDGNHGALSVGTDGSFALNQGKACQFLEIWKAL